VPVASYLEGPRPTSLVTLRGAGACGQGECVAWTAAAHAAFRERMAAVPRGRWTLGEWAAATGGAAGGAYERAALEAAAIDLALRQHGTTVFGLLGVRPRPVRYVVSFEKVADPAARARREPAGIDLKLDADPGWDEDTYAALAALGRVAVLDFKGSGSAAAHERAHRALPAALLEDPRPAASPWSASLVRRVSFDAPVTTADALPALPVCPAAVNVKPARMGGILEALECVARCAAAGIDVYFGGMFEVGIGRRQLWALAALLCPEAPNDVAPLAIGPEAPPRPERLRIDPGSAGFGSAP
jgi:L-alanine-DL-glutamate epimerase-like enolase superfamily enzyme